VRLVPLCRYVYPVAAPACVHCAGCEAVGGGVGDIDAAWEAEGAAAEKGNAAGGDGAEDGAGGGCGGDRADWVVC
jgi:hypothetical protein